MPLEQPIIEQPIASVSRIGKISDAFRQLVKGFFYRWREHRAGFMFTSASVLVSLGSMLAGVFTMRWISPEDLGLWNSVRMALV